MSVTASQGTFGHKLQTEFTARDMGARTLARQMVSAGHGGSLDNRRRQIIRWLRGTTPSQENRHLVEDLLGVPRDSLKGNDEDEEADPVARILGSLTLDEVLKALVRQAVAEAIRQPVGGALA